MKKELPKVYEPQKYENNIYEKWEKSDFFNPDTCEKNNICKKDADTFSIVLPPPNVTGTLHIGHAAMLAIQDSLIRYHRMKGDRTLWLPGTDHAAVATESKVEKILIKEKGYKKPKQELGKEKFLKEVTDFAKISHDTIVNQTKRMGSSLDWGRETYTLDETRHKAVYTVFKKMYDDGLIYRGFRVINWSVKGQSTCSDDELVHIERQAKVYTFKYSEDFPIEIATTRPETKLGDTAVAVHPKDKRYKKFIGKTFEVKNFADSGIDLKIKIIANEHVDMEYGTGAVGVTPAHSSVDFDMYMNQKALEDEIKMIEVIDKNGKMTSETGNYFGLDVLECRKKVVEALKKNNLFIKEEDVIQNVGTSDRFGDVVEALPMTQWFIDVNKKFKINSSKLKNIKNGEEFSLKELMQTVVKSGQIKIIPDQFEKVYFNWIDNLKDWCISRQIWFGHQIPVWYREKSKVKSQKSKVWEFGIGREDIFNKINSGEKIFEIRVGRERSEIEKNWEDLKIGEKINFSLTDGEGGEVLGSNIKKTIKNIYHFSSTEEMFTNEKVKIELDKHKEEYKKDKEYLENNFTDRIKKYGIYVFELEDIKDEEKDIYVGVEAPEDKTNFVFLHGFYRTKEVKDPLNWLNQKLSKENNFWSILPDCDKPNYKKQSEFVLKNAKINKDTIIVAHSLGCKLIMKMIEENNLHIKKLILIAAKIISNHKETKDYIDENNINFEKLKKLVDEIVVVQAETDHICSDEEQKDLAEKLDARLVKVNKSASHFNEEKNLELLEECKKNNWIQDTDTLDTWFSSGLWTFSTLANSPDQIRIENDKIIIDSEDFRNFHPTTVMETGYDIIFFWVARMILMTTYALGDIPFETVYLHGLVRDEKGRKMSKSLENTIDPLEMIEKYGADATRLSLLIGNTPGNDMKLSEEKIAGFRNFTNKLWNISRFMLLNIDNPKIDIKLPKAKTLADKWILDELFILIMENRGLISSFNLSLVGDNLKDFTWNKLADWYLEIAKIEGDKSEILNYVLNTILKLWHPFMPFVTEEIWSEIYGDKNMLMVEKFPTQSVYTKEKDFTKGSKVREDFNVIKNIITKIRAVRSENKIEPAKKINVIISAGDKRDLLEENKEIIKSLARLEKIEIFEKTKKPEKYVAFVESGVEVFLDLLAGVDTEKEKERIKKEIEKIEPYLKSLEAKLANKSFTDNAPEKVIEIEKNKLAQAKDKIDKLQKQLENLK